MTYEVFENAKSIRIMTNKNDRSKFDQIKNKLRLKHDIDLIMLCAAISLSKYKKFSLDLQKMPSAKKITDISAFNERKLYDILIMSLFKNSEKRINIFENLFYTGFLNVKSWFETLGNKAESEIEAYKSLWKFVHD